MPNHTIPKIFVDTNIWFSAFYGSANCLKIVNAHLQEKILAVISQEVLAEIVRNIKRKLPQALPGFQKTLMNTPPQMVTNPEAINIIARKFVHLKDQKIFSSAIIAKVDFFVTGNIKHFKINKLEKKTKIKILLPKQLVDILRL